MKNTLPQVGAEVNDILTLLFGGFDKIIIMEIIPAILEKTTDDLIRQLKNLRVCFSHFQIDIADGRFVPNRTVQIEDINNLKFRTLDFRLWTLDFHLMVDNPGLEINKLNQIMANIKIKTVLIHLRTSKNSQLVNPKFMTRFQLGIVLNPEDQIEDNWETIKDFPVIQIMSVRPGFQGAPFLPETLKKIIQLRGRGFGGKIYLDGGINNQSIPLILQNQHRPDALCVGSYLKQDASERLKSMKHLLQTKINL